MTAFEQDRQHRRAYLQHVYRCRSGCHRARREYCPAGVRLRARFEQAIGITASTSPARGSDTQEATA